MGKYPLEIEISSFCTLQCKSCINKDFEERFLLSEENFEKTLRFLSRERDAISFVDISGVGDIFTHPQITDFLERIYETFQGYPINLNFSQKGQRMTQEHIDILVKMKDSGMNIDIFVGIFSIREPVYKYLSGGDSCKRALEFAKKMHNLGFNTALELLNNHFSHQEYEKFYEICDAIGCSGMIKNITNFGGLLNKRYTYLFGYNNKYESQDIIRANEKEGDDRYKDTKCGSTPYISAKGEILVCSYLQGYDDERGKIGTIDDLENLSMGDIFEKAYAKIYTKMCNSCSLYKEPKQWYSEDYYINDHGAIVRDKVLVKLYPYTTAEDIIFLYHNDRDFIAELLADESNVNKHEKIDFLFILELCSKVHNLDFDGFFHELLASWGLQDVYDAFREYNFSQKDITREKIQDFCNAHDVEPIEFYLFALQDKIIDTQKFFTAMATLIRIAQKEKNATNLAYIVILKDKVVGNPMTHDYGEELLVKYYQMFS